MHTRLHSQESATTETILTSTGVAMIRNAANLLRAALLLLPLAVIPEISTAQEETATMAIHLLIRFEVKEDRLDDFTPIMQNIERDMASEAGFESATVYRDVDDPRVFTLVEIWSSRKRHEEHFDRIVATGDWANILTMLQKDPVMGYADTF